MSPRDIRFSAPLVANTVRESACDGKRKLKRVGKLALIDPLIKRTSGRCVAAMTWMPLALDLATIVDSFAELALASLVSTAGPRMSANSSIRITTYGI